jgi:hypothetical protein
MTIKKFLVEISQILDELKIEYAVSGGIAVSVWGRPRYTADLDIVVEIGSEKKVEELVVALLKKFKVGYIDKETALLAYKNKGEFNLIEPEYGLKADFFVIGQIEHQKLEIKRAQKKKIGNKLIKIISPEDLIIAKLRWYQISQSDRQLEDIVTVLGAGNIDAKYLNLWVEKLGFEKEWGKAKALKSK